MKRPMKSENDFGQNKRSRSSNMSGYDEALAGGKYELRVLIPSKSAGAVIGKGGSFIKDIRSKFDANVTVPDKQTPERVLTITCSQDNIIDCFAEVYKKLAEDQRGEGEVRMLIHQSHAGALIGRGGSKIKELREQTKSQLKVFQECCPSSTDRLLVINVEQERMSEVVGDIISFLKEIPIKGSQRPYDTSNYDPHLNYGGHVDKNYNFTGGRNMGPPMPPPHFDSYRGGPPPYHGGSPMGGGGGGYGGGGRGGPPPPLSYMQDNISTTQVTIPNELGGTIIGKGGERINRIRGDSGAKIEIGSSNYGNDERIITITGTSHQIQMAQYLLQQSVRSSEAGRRYLREQR